MAASLNEQIALFNQEVHAYEDKQQQEIGHIWEKIDKEYLSTGKLSEIRSERLKNGFAQALMNLDRMIKAKSLYEADLYRQSYIKALESVKKPVRRFIMLQTLSLELAHDAHDVASKLTAVEKELVNLKSLYGTDEQAIFESAHRELIEMSTAQDTATFKTKKSQFLEHLADIHERAHDRNSVEKACETDVEEAIKKGQSIYNARSSYLEDKNHWLTRASDIAEKSWSGLGYGVGAASLVLGAIGTAVVGIAAAPIVGIIGAVYGVIDLGKTIGSSVSEETTIKLGEREVAKPKTSWKDKLKQFAKKALPIGLCVLGAAIGIASVILTAGVAAAVFTGIGVALSVGGIGQMIYNKVQEKKEVVDLLEEHKAINEPFEKKADELIKQIPHPSSGPRYTDSINESMTLLAGHDLTANNIKTIETESESPVEKEDEGESGSGNAKEETEQKAKAEEPEAISEEVEDETDGGKEDAPEETAQLPEDDLGSPVPRP